MEHDSGRKSPLPAPLAATIDTVLEWHWVNPRARHFNDDGAAPRMRNGRTSELVPPALISLGPGVCSKASKLA
jgi:hypothetical protein